jgi:serine/threonine protein kinase
MDYLDSGDLRYYLNKQYHFSEDQASIFLSLSIIEFIIRCIMEGLNYLHSKNIIHRDLKPENIIFDKKGYCRITDLGIARYWRAENSN